MEIPELDSLHVAAEVVAAGYHPFLKQRIYDALVKASAEGRKAGLEEAARILAPLADPSHRHQIPDPENDKEVSRYEWARPCCFLERVREAAGKVGV